MRPEPYNLWGSLRAHMHRATPSLKPCWSILCHTPNPARRQAATYLLQHLVGRPRLRFAQGEALTHLLDIVAWAEPSTHVWTNLTHTDWKTPPKLMCREGRRHLLVPPGERALTRWRHDVMMDVCGSIRRTLTTKPQDTRIARRALGVIQDIILAMAHLDQGIEARHTCGFHSGGSLPRENIWSLRGEHYYAESSMDAMLERVGRRLEPASWHDELSWHRGWRMERWLKGSSLSAWYERRLVLMLLGAASAYDPRKHPHHADVRAGHCPLEGVP